MKVNLTGGGRYRLVANKGIFEDRDGKYCVRVRFEEGSCHVALCKVGRKLETVDVADLAYKYEAPKRGNKAR